MFSKQWEASSVITINSKLRFYVRSWFLLAAGCALIQAVASASAFADGPRTIKLIEPLDGATVRETVPVKIAPADLPTEGYVTVSVDKIFRTAKLIDPNNSLIYTWDSQAAFQDPNNPGQDQFTEDGPHEIEVAIYDHDGTLLANGTSTVKLVNKVTNLPDGITLSYAWSEDSTLRYKRHTEISILNSDQGNSPTVAQTADVRFSRSIEDANSGEYLVRDQVYDNGIITVNGQSTPVQDLFTLKSRYRTVNRFGDVLVEETPFSAGDHFGFPIVEVPARRITEGDSWESKIEAGVTWANAKPTVLSGNARLDGFEWQDGYPTAKVIETYDGPAQFYADARGTIQFQADNVHLVRTYWFAYNSKRLVRVRTEIDIDGNIGADSLAALGSAGGGAAPLGAAPPGAQFAVPAQNPFGGDEGDNNQAAGTVGDSTSTSAVKLHIVDDTSLVGV
jgi:hypothetical protein